MTCKTSLFDGGIQQIQNSGFSKLFKQAEEAIKIVEHRHKDLIIPAVNELRYAGYHISVYVQEPVKTDEIQKACGHCKRATCDAYEAGILYCWQEYRTFQNDYRNCVVTEIIPDYLEKRKIIKNSLDFVRSIDKETKTSNYAKCREYHEDLIDIVELLNNAREELNKTIKKDRQKTQFLLVSLFVSLSGFFATIVFGLLSI